MNFILEFTLKKFGKFCPFSNKTGSQNDKN